MYTSSINNNYKTVIYCFFGNPQVGKINKMQSTIINKELPTFVALNNSYKILINPSYKEHWLFNRDIINFINKPLVFNYEVLETEDEVLAFKC